MASTLTTAFLTHAGQSAIDVGGREGGLLEFIKSAASYDKWVIDWNKSGQKKYGRASSVFCFHSWGQTTDYLIGQLAEFGRYGISPGDFDEVSLAHIRTIKVGTPDCFFFFARDLHKEIKNLEDRLARIKKRAHDFLE